MKIIFYQPGLTPENIHRLPWSTIVELGVKLKDEGVQVIICTTKSTYSRNNVNTINGIDILELPRFWLVTPILKLFTFIRSEKPDLFVSHIKSSWSFRTAFLFLLLRVFTTIELIALNPGGFHSIKDIIKAHGHLNKRDLAPYYYQSLTGPIGLAFLLKISRIRQIYFFSPRTEYIFNKVSFFNLQTSVSYALPTQENVLQERLQVTANSNYHQFYENKHPCKNILFLGPPSAIRGYKVLVESFNRLDNNGKINNLHLTLAFRNDANTVLDKSKIQSPHIKVISNSLNVYQLKKLILNSYAVFLPFLIIPSETPLIALEVLQLQRFLVYPSSSCISSILGDYSPFAVDPYSPDTIDACLLFLNLLEPNNAVPWIYNMVKRYKNYLQESNNLFEGIINR